MSNIAVVHLVRQRNGTEPFRKFLDSYRANRGGVDHELILIFKGFLFGKIPHSYAELLSDIRFRPLFAFDSGFDIRPYFLCARKFQFPYFCFLNSFSVLQDKDWLGKLLDWGSRDEIGAAGATGSWESHLNNVIQGGLRNARVLRKIKRHFHHFPNPHLRTNAFLIRRERFLSVRHGWLLTKTQAHRFESGRNGFTRQLFDKKLEPVVVGRDGKGYFRDDWPSSLTFRIGDQSNLLVADNKTHQYVLADSFLRNHLSRLTWGDQAVFRVNPAPPQV
jgi:hypothetical protein